MKKKNLNFLLALLAALALVFAGACSDGSDDVNNTEQNGDGTTGGNNPSSSNPTDGTGTDDESGNGTCECGTTGCTGGSSCEVCNGCCDDCGTEAEAESDSLTDEIKGTEWEYVSNENVSIVNDVITLVSVTLSFDDSEATVTGEAAWAVGSGQGSVSHAGTFTASSYKVEGDTVTVTLGSGTSVDLPLTLDGTSYSESNGVVTIELDSSSELAVATGFNSDNSASFEVSCNGESGKCDTGSGCTVEVDIFGSQSTSGQITTSSAFTYKEGV